MPIGGLGLLAIAALITIVSPGAWWLLGVGAFGGFAIGGVLVATRRRHALRQGGRRNILLPLLLLATCLPLPSEAQPAPRPARRVDRMDGALAAFTGSKVDLPPGRSARIKLAGIPAAQVQIDAIETAGAGHEGTSRSR